MRRGIRVGVDVGAARVGVALSDPDGLIATPWASLPAQDDPVGALVDLVAHQEAIEVVVGLPRSLSGQEGPAAATARAFAADLRREVPAAVSVRVFDERLSTVQAHRALHASGRPGRRHREVVDQVAAVTILQTALEAERVSGQPAGESVGRRRPRHTRAAPDTGKRIEGDPG
ncbi:putative Holliday junction resolvase [Kineosphaera limosa]|uniref:Putative pre-16S rRNA nuclease n=1 Tax=Kineosphaera limosa NBRC 100340 TaxID=1184609 RepID=K6VJG4_9MICO|nr:Holliday junction resolvase RuvX [Kineosphaera limosa]NYD99189.1 putative Holliday junction resolvase [Kineosphaera limosa]GAB96353.1 putative Holliday junction resolvase [Kineosphaera limosa NBRC 100340]